jgi:hypothetical protein
MYLPMTDVDYLETIRCISASRTLTAERRVRVIQVLADDWNRERARDSEALADAAPGGD